ncbi:MAG: hypothetical protein FJX57_18095 [Alphaproteobacteria bacterium]|nr:hypothetical protein [Alphaproteobacteria bacterium]
MTIRRLVCAVFAAALFACSGLASAQVPRITIFELIGCDRDGPLFGQLRDLGWVDGRNVAFDCVLGSDRLGELDRLAVEIVARAPTVIVTNSTLTIRALQRATRTVPIVMAASFDAVREGFVQSLARPGGNTTGVTNVTLELLAKRFGLAREILPQAKRVALLTRRGADQAYLAVFVSELREAAAQSGFAVATYQAVDIGDVARVIDAIARDGADLLYVGDGPLFTGRNAPEIARIARAHGLPLTGSAPMQARAGALFVYGPDPMEGVQKAARHVDRILRGARPSDIPVEQPTRFELVLNLGTARALGLAIPPLIVARADEVIE